MGPLELPVSRAIGSDGVVDDEEQQVVVTVTVTTVMTVDMEVLRPCRPGLLPT